MIKLFTKIALAMFISLAFGEAHAQIYVPNTTFGGIGSGLNQFDEPFDITESDGKFFVADRTNSRISVWTQSGNTFGNLTTFGGFGSGMSQFNNPSSVKVSDGKIYVADSDNNRISVWTTSGNTFGNLTTFGGVGTATNQFRIPFYVTVDNNKIYVSDFFNYRMSVWTINGNTFGNLTTFGSNGSGLGKFDRLNGIEVSDGKIYVSEESNNRVSVWTSTGNTFGVLTTFGGLGSGLNQLNSPLGVSIADGKIYVSENGNSRISVWTTDGNNFGTLTTFGSYGNGLNNFITPRGITVLNGKIFIADRNNNRICIWEEAQATSIIGISSPQTVCSGVVVPLSVTATGTSLTYRWFKDNVRINGATLSTYNATVKGAALYFVSITGAGGSVTSAEISLGLRPNTSINTHPTSQSICGGNMANFTVSASGAGALDYAWSNGGNKKSINTNALGNYQVTVTGTCGMAVSTIVSLTTTPSTALVIQPQSLNTCSGQTATLTASATGTGAISYLWDNGSTNNFITTTAGFYTVTATGACGVAVSNIGSIVNYESMPNNPIVTGNVTICGGTTTNVNAYFFSYPVSHTHMWNNGETSFLFSTSLSGLYTVTITTVCESKTFVGANVTVNPITTITSQSILETVCGTNTVGLFVNADGKNKTYLWSNGSTGDEPTVGAGVYSATVSGACGTAISSPITVTSFQNTSISMQTSNKTICGGSSTFFGVSPTGHNLMYLWSNAVTTNQFGTSVAGIYQTTVTGTCGTAVSNLMELTVNPITTITSQSILETVCGTNTVGLFVNAEGKNKTYLWSNSSTGDEPTVGAGIYTVTVSGECGSPAISSPITVTGLQNTTIQSFSQTAIECEGVDVSILVSATGSNLSYKWSNGRTVDEIITTALGSYMVTVSGTCGTAISNEINLQVKPATSIVSISENQVINAGATTNLSISATGENVSYLWSNSSGSETISNVGAGAYSVTATGFCGSLVRNILVQETASVSVTGISSNGNPSNATSPLSITISGTGFVNGATVTINGVAINPVTVQDANTIVATLPSGLTLPLSISVQNPNQVASNSVQIAPIDITTPVASISGVSANGALTSATSITITGTGFVNGATITVNGVALSNFTVDGTTIIATIPSGTLLSSNNVILVQNPNQVASANTSVVVTDVTLKLNTLTHEHSNSLTIYPNPSANGEFRIENGELGARMYVFNAQGSVVYSQTITSTSTEVFANLSRGIYLVKVGNASKKLVVE
ncbi:MAG: T9SS C-terminal target domain-containing protein [Cytophagales bacterium]|nr:MAG: T9SS C-terminal target domain-containing protein [Cytophagales bacterium]